jgi:hypothetical protein
MWINHREGPDVYGQCLGSDAVIDRCKRDPLSIEGSFDVIFDPSAAYSYLVFRDRLASDDAFVTTIPSPVEAGVKRFVFSSVIHPVLSNLTPYLRSTNECSMLYLLTSACLNSDNTISNRNKSTLRFRLLIFPFRFCRRDRFGLSPCTAKITATEQKRTPLSNVFGNSSWCSRICHVTRPSRRMATVPKHALAPSSNQAILRRGGSLFRAFATVLHSQQSQSIEDHGQ